MRVLTLSEFDRMLSAAADNARDYCILMFLGGAGLRVAELTTIRIGDIDFDQGYLRIPAEKAKGGRERTVYLCKQVLESVPETIRGFGDDWLFPSVYKPGRGKPISVRGVQLIVANYARLAGLGNVHVYPHLLRHSFAVWSLDAGVPVGDLQQQLGHASLATTGIYLRVNPSHRKGSYERAGMFA